MNKVKAVIFDFDGVILDSANIKTEAFLQMFEEYPEYLEAIKEYHIQHQGITRYQKFEWIYTELLGKPYNQQVKEKLGEEFSSLVFQKIMDVSAIPGAMEFLQALKEKNIPAFISSGTPDEELNKIVDKRELRKYFKKVYGSDISKVEAIKTISNNEEIDYSNLLFLGDAVTDYNAAAAKDVPFVAVYSEEMEDFWVKKNIIPIHNLMEIIHDRDKFILAS